MFFFVKQKTAYELRISDWSSDVCSSDLRSRNRWQRPNRPSASLDMALKTTPYDSARYLRTDEERAAYLATCMEEAPEAAAFIAYTVGVVARSRKANLNRGSPRRPDNSLGRASTRESVLLYVVSTVF